jgi:hypothetical protein
MILTRLPQRDPELIKQHVNEWRQMAVLSAPAVGMNTFGDDMQMDVDPIATSPLPSPGSSGPTLNTKAEPRTSRASMLLASPMFGRGDTPPPIARSSSLSPLPPSPEILDPETKTAQIIAQIREKAYAMSMSSPLDSPTPEFEEELDDSSDDDDIILWSPTKGRGKQMKYVDCRLRSHLISTAPI